MQRAEILGKLKDILEEVLDLEDLAVTEETTANDIEDWDSIMHVEIIVAIEEEFDVKFKTAEIVKFKNLSDMITGILDKTA